MLDHLQTTTTVTFWRPAIQYNLSRTICEFWSNQRPFTAHLASCKIMMIGFNFVCHPNFPVNSAYMWMTGDTVTQIKQKQLKHNLDQLRTSTKQRRRRIGIHPFLQSTSGRGHLEQPRYQQVERNWKGLPSSWGLAPANHICPFGPYASAILGIQIYPDMPLVAWGQIKTQRLPSNTVKCKASRMNSQLQVKTFNHALAKHHPLHVLMSHDMS